MTTQYNVAVKVLKEERRNAIVTSLQGYRIFTDRSGNLDGTNFSRETVPYIGDITIVKTLKKEAAEKAHEVLSEIEGLLVLPITESIWEQDKKSIDTLFALKSA